MRRICCGRTHLYVLLAASKITALKRGRRTYIIADSLDDFVDSLPVYRPMYRAQKAQLGVCTANKDFAGGSDATE
jgi:hypothetical protein